MSEETIYISVEDKGDNILLVHHQYNDLETMKKEVKKWEAISGKNLIITTEVKE